MASERERYQKGKSRALYVIPWANVEIDSNYRVTTARSKTGALDGDVKPLIPYPTLGNPICFGDVEGPVKISNNLADQKDYFGLDAVPGSRSFTKYDPQIEWVCLWSGDERVERLVTDPGVESNVDKYAGGKFEPNESNLLLVGINRLDPLYAYDAERPLIFTFVLWWKVSWDPIDREWDGLPEKFKLKCHPLKGNDPVNGGCLPPGKQLYHRWYEDIDGNLVSRRGRPITLDTGPYRSRLSLSSPNGW